MEITQKLGILIFTGVPAIMGGGVVYALSGKLAAVAVFEAILYLAVAIFLIKK